MSQRQAPGGNSTISFADMGGGGRSEEAQHHAVSSNAFAQGANQNNGNVLTSRPTTRVRAPPGGASTISFGNHDGPAAQSTAVSANRFATGSNQNEGNVMTGRSTTRLHAPPGGMSSMNSIMQDDVPTPPNRMRATRGVMPADHDSRRESFPRAGNTRIIAHDGNDAVERAREGERIPMGGESHIRFGAGLTPGKYSISQTSGPVGGASNVAFNDNPSPMPRHLVPESYVATGGNSTISLGTYQPSPEPVDVRLPRGHGRESLAAGAPANEMESRRGETTMTRPWEAPERNLMRPPPGGRADICLNDDARLQENRSNNIREPVGGKSNLVLGVSPGVPSPAPKRRRTEDPDPTPQILKDKHERQRGAVPPGGHSNFTFG